MTLVFIMKFRVFFVVCCVTYLAVDAAPNYCQLACKEVTEKNTACDCTKGTNCSTEYKQLALNENERTFMIGNHNKYRKKVARGNEALLWHVRVANMMAIQYDPELEHVAMCWAMKCTPGEDACRRTSKFERVGQNSYTVQGSCDGFEILHEAAKEWYISCIAKGDCFMNTEFNQFIWATTTHIGCARVQLTKNECRIICNYGPREIYKPKAVFMVGPPGSRCPKTTKNVNGLCEPGTPETVRAEASAAIRPAQLKWLMPLLFLLICKIMCLL